MIDLCQWRARIGSWNCSCTSSGSIYPCIYWTSNSGIGDVELNPGPTLTDKPTKDELIELLSSSKFTAGTWEQFVCHLPNMTQDTVSSIKHRVEELCDIQPSPFDYMSAVAQYYLDSSPDITWKSITIALLNADEINLAHQIFDSHSGKKRS
uniref:Death domain-containing protein n=1 Tax=Amphimedon queenslandica TaxID=400682 RepID=A0A1X7SHS2_AMPQE